MVKAVNGWFSFFFNDTATTEIYTLSLHDALPISPADLPFPAIGGLEPIGSEIIAQKSWQYYPAQR